ncbi:hypothetical protein AK973_3709 [Pseudomonas brassicacearum]|nr:hypothetical protein AK973_3709 [Pseudomonas brassicacearum]
MGARLARDGRSAVYQLNRDIVHRGQALLPQWESLPRDIGHSSARFTGYSNFHIFAPSHHQAVLRHV